MEVQTHAFLTSVVDGSEWSASRPECFTIGGKPVVPAEWAPKGEIRICIYKNRIPVVHLVAQGIQC
jgi:hypothetical protein